MEQLLNPPIKLQDNDNYRAWAFATRNALESARLWPYVEGTAPLPKSKARFQSKIALQASRAEWGAKDKQALNFIFLNCVDGIQQILLRFTTSRSCWDFLKSAYGRERSHTNKIEPTPDDGPNAASHTISAGAQPATASAKDGKSGESTTLDAPKTATSSTAGSKISTEHVGIETLEFPNWFMENCVFTAAQMASTTIPLVMTDGKNTSSESGHNGTYLLTRPMYAPLANIIKMKGNRQQKRFIHDAIYVSYPIDGGSVQFLRAVVDHFTKDAAADLVRFSWDDALDVGPHIVSPPIVNVAIGGVATPSKLDATTSEGLESNRLLTTFRNILRAPVKKRLRLRCDAASNTPLVVHVQVPRSLPHDICPILRELREALSPVAYKTIMVVTPDSSTTDGMQKTDEISPCTYDGCFMKFAPDTAARWDSIPKALGQCPGKYIINLAPSRTLDQVDLLERDRIAARSSLSFNVRQLQRSIAETFQKRQVPPMLQPYASLPWLDNTPAYQWLSNNALSEEAETEIMQNMGSEPSDERIQATILEFGSRQSVLHDWKEAPSMVESVWAWLPQDLQDTIGMIIADTSKYKWENRFLANLVKPDDVNEGWSDIELDQASKDSIVRLASQRPRDSPETYGVLKQGFIGGALLYGPPGTGKTHLARVLAHEMASITIVMTPADIEHKYTGQTEAAIKGVFNLAKMLAPSILFFDEADSLFRARSEHDREWQRTRKNQFLSEMEGLRRAKSPPFVVLATNFPQDLDRAVLRRVPGRIYLGLPTDLQRLAILYIFLREEILDDDVRLDWLADRTKGYSGSDLHSLCVQAALLSAPVNDEQKRILTRQDFETAIQRVSSTISASTLSHIEEFAKEFDPSAYRMMKPSQHDRSDATVRLQAAATDLEEGEPEVDGD